MELSYIHVYTYIGHLCHDSIIYEDKFFLHYRRRKALSIGGWGGGGGQCSGYWMGGGGVQGGKLFAGGKLIGAPAPDQ